MVRKLFAALFALLLVCMQLQAIVHEVDHLRAKVSHGKAVAIENAGSDICLECALLAAGSNIASDSSVPLAFAATEASSAAARVDYLRALPPPAHYRSRAPPALA
jgi:hypothetical protein